MFHENSNEKNSDKTILLNSNCMSLKIPEDSMAEKIEEPKMIEALKTNPQKNN